MLVSKSKSSVTGGLGWIGACVLVLLSVAPLAQAGTGAPERVLLIGNSYTRFNMMPRLLARMAESAGRPLRVDAEAHGGYTLRMHWRSRQPRHRILSRRYDHVVLQGHSLRPVDRPAELERYVNRFASLTRRAGASLVLYETWPRHPRAPLYRRREELRGPEQMARTVSEAYRRLAALHHAALAPVGRAFQGALQSHPELELYRSDGAHPTWAGSYLAAAVLFGTLTGAEPTRITYAPWEMSAAEAASLLRLAAETLAAESPRRRERSTSATIANASQGASDPASPVVLQPPPSSAGAAADGSTAGAAGSDSAPASGSRESRRQVLKPVAPPQ